MDEYEATKKRFQDEQQRIEEKRGYIETAEGKALLNECRAPLVAFINAELRNHKRTRTRLPLGLDVPLRRLDADVIALSALAALMFSPAILPVVEDREDWERQIETKEQIGRALLGEWRGRRKARKEVRRRGNLGRYHSNEWNRDDIVAAGAWLEDCIILVLPEVFYRDEHGTPCIQQTAIERASAIARQLMLRNPVFSPQETAGQMDRIPNGRVLDGKLSPLCPIRADFR